MFTVDPDSKIFLWIQENVTDSSDPDPQHWLEMQTNRIIHYQLMQGFVKQLKSKSEAAGPAKMFNVATSNNAAT